MNVSNLLRIAFRALQHNMMRAFLTMLGIIIGVGAVIAMVAIGEGSKASIQAQISAMGSNMVTVRPNSNVAGGVRLDATSVQSLSLDDVQALLKQGQYMSAVSPGVSSKGQAINGSLNWSTTLQGVSPAFLDIRDWPMKSGVVFGDKDVSSAAKVCLIGQTVVDNIFINGEDPVGQVIRFSHIPFKIIGVLGKKGENAFGQDQDDVIIAPYTTVMKRIMATVYLQNIYASAKNETVTDSASEEISTIIRASHRLKPTDADDFTVRTQAELINTFSSTSKLLTVLLTAIAAISLVVGGIGIMNIMYVSVTERTKEIGLRMALGARGIDILYQFLIEAILISITGGIIGVILGIAASSLIRIFLSWPTLVSQSSVVLSFMVCALTGVFFGYYPALKASRLDPIDALRYE